MKYQFLIEKKNEKYKEWWLYFVVSMGFLFMFYIFCACIGEAGSEVLSLCLILLILFLLCYFLREYPEKYIKVPLSISLEESLLLMETEDNKIALQYSDIVEYGYQYLSKNYCSSFLLYDKIFIKVHNTNYVFSNIANNNADKFMTELSILLNKVPKKVNSQFNEIILSETSSYI